MYETTLRIWSMSSSSYFSGSFPGFFSRIFMILRPLGISVNDPHLESEACCPLPYLSCPIVSPDPSSLSQPAPADSSLPSQSFSSSALMLMSSLNSLGMLGYYRQMQDIVMTHTLLLCPCPLPYFYIFIKSITLLFNFF